ARRLGLRPQRGRLRWVLEGRREAGLRLGRAAHVPVGVPEATQAGSLGAADLVLVIASPYGRGRREAPGEGRPGASYPHLLGVFRLAPSPTGRGNSRPRSGEGNSGLVGGGGGEVRA